MRYPVNPAFVLFVILLSPLHAEEQKAESGISIELLEFLGEWEMEDGEWLDPMELDDEYFSTLSPEKGEKQDE
ncbi:MAG: hypothetical protein HY356_05550 [Gammaproteobacteria bacterium]|nr:hypothetical protein [Gammaproteobacteria bacterium]